jgi:hypothetical protein
MFVIQLAFLLRPAALSAVASAPPSAVVFSAIAKVKEKVNPRKRQRRKRHENEQEFNSQHIHRENKQQAAEILQQQSGDPDRQPGRRRGLLWRQ